jgi:predicted HNH restriction endonuclease
MNISDEEQARRIAAHNKQRLMASAHAKAIGKDLMDRAKTARKQTNRAFAELTDKYNKLQNTFDAIHGPVGKFLVNYCGFRDGQPMPLWGDLYEALEKAVLVKKGERCEDIEDEDPKKRD